MCVSTVLLHILGGHRVFPLGYHVLRPLYCHLQAFALYIHHEQQSLPSVCPGFLDNWILSDFPTTDYWPLLGFLCIKCHWPFPLRCFSSPTTFLLRHTCSRTNFLHLSSHDNHCLVSSSNPFLYSHCQDDYQIPFSSAKEKGFFHLFFSHACCFSLLWELHIYLHKAISKWKSCFEQRNSCAQHFSCPYVEPIHLYSEE